MRIARCTSYVCMRAAGCRLRVVCCVCCVRLQLCAVLLHRWPNRCSCNFQPHRSALSVGTPALLIVRAARWTRPLPRGSVAMQRVPGMLSATWHVVHSQGARLSDGKHAREVRPAVPHGKEYGQPDERGDRELTLRRLRHQRKHDQRQRHPCFRDVTPRTAKRQLVGMARSRCRCGSGRRSPAAHRRDAAMATV